MLFWHLARFRIAHIPQVCSAFQIIDQLQNSYRYTITKKRGNDALSASGSILGCAPNKIDQTKNY